MAKSKYLKLVYKEIYQNKKELFVFEQNGVQKRLTLSQGVNLISQFDPKDRNCKDSRGIISLKPNEGELKVIKRREVTRGQYKGVRLYIGKKEDFAFTIYSNDTWFYKNVMPDILFLKSCAKYIKEIDNAVIVDYKLMQAKSEKGVYSVKDFSTGLKTILNVVYLLRKKDTTPIIVNATECGDKVMNILFEIVNNSRIGLYITHDILEMSESFQYYVNDKKIEDTMELSDYF